MCKLRQLLRACNVHDPYLIQTSSGGLYFRFSTDNKISDASVSFVKGPWTTVGSMLPDGSNPLIWVAMTIFGLGPDNQVYPGAPSPLHEQAGAFGGCCLTNDQAPDAHIFDDLYYVYHSAFFRCSRFSRSLNHPIATFFIPVLFIQLPR